MNETRKQLQSQTTDSREHLPTEVCEPGWREAGLSGRADASVDLKLDLDFSKVK